MPQGTRAAKLTDCSLFIYFIYLLCIFPHRPAELLQNPITPLTYLVLPTADRIAATRELPWPLGAGPLGGGDPDCDRLCKYTKYCT
jgi:hypothetical protein